MPSLIQPVVSLLDRIQRRLVRSRPGSVLILTVVMVVLLALLGTALLSTTQNDRYVSTQNAVNTQVDLLVEAVKNLARATIEADLSGVYPGTTTVVYRPPNDTGASASLTFDSFDAPYVKKDVASAAPADIQNDDWLASRAPYLAPTGGYVNWPALSAPLNGTGFDSPFVVNNSNAIDTSLASTYTQRTRMVPTYVKPSGWTGDALPAFRLTTPAVRYVIAGDADGDGIADSGLVKFPIGEIDGVTYYYAVRIIDNNSAINVNTAWSSYADLSAAGVPVDAIGETLSSAAENLGFYPSHVGLYERLHLLGDGNPRITTPAEWQNVNNNATAELRSLHYYMFGYYTAGPFNAGAPYNVPTLSMYNDPLIRVGTGSSSNPTVRSLEQFQTQGDAMYHQIGRRIDNPGYYGTSSLSMYKSFSINDAVSLAYRGGVLINLNSTPSLLEQRFIDAQGATSTIADSIYRSTGNFQPASGTGSGSIAGKAVYPANRVLDWFDENYNWLPLPTTPIATAPLTPTPLASVGTYGTASRPLTQFRSIRSLLTTYNPVSNLAPARYENLTSKNLPIGSGVGGMLPYRPEVPKTNINTAKFEELWRAFWCVMSDDSTGSGTPFAYSGSPAVDTYAGQAFGVPNPVGTPTLTNSTHPLRMFRNVLRDPRVARRTYMDGKEMVLLRSLIAANNAVSLRELQRTSNPLLTDPFNPATPAPWGRYRLRATVDDAPKDVMVTVYRHAPQLFITEIYANTDAMTGTPVNDNGYVAVELYNPYPFALDLSKTPLRIGRISRPQGLASYPLDVEEVGTAINSGTVPAGGYLLLENYDEATSGAAQNRPEITGLVDRGTIPNTSSLTVISVPQLHQVFDHEMVIFLGGTGSTLATDWDARPIDSYDFSGFVLQPGLGRQLHYARRSGDSHRWQFVYPGRYDAGSSYERRQQGTQLSATWDLQTGIDPWKPANNSGPPNAPSPSTFTLGGASVSAGNPNDNPEATYDLYGIFTIPLMNDYPMLHPLPNPAPSGPALKYPFGLFARNLDMLQIPFIGSYRIDLADTGSPSLVEINPITMDAAFADDTVTGNNPEIAGTSGDYWHEQLGRFCPIPDVGASGNIDDFSDDASRHAYAFSRKLLDYFTVQSPSADYLPAISPNWAKTNQSSGYSNSNLPQPVENDGDGTAADEDYDTANGTPAPQDVGREDTLPVHGLVNINTAPWAVLASIPFLPAGSDNYTIDSSGSLINAGNQTDDNIDLAREIVRWRDLDGGSGTPGGPFRSIFDLYRIPAFREIQRLRYTDDSATDPGAAQGDFYPALGAGITDQVRRDFKEFYLMLNRVSNLITTQSDSFTIYVVVQGWRGVGGSKPELVVQRRVAFIQDRSGLTLSNPNLPAPINVPND